MYVYFKPGDVDPFSHSEEERAEYGWYHVPTLSDLRTQRATRDIPSDTITVSSESRKEKADRRQEFVVVSEPQFNALKIMVDDDLEPRVKNLEEINKTLTE